MIRRGKILAVVFGRIRRRLPLMILRLPPHGYSAGCALAVFRDAEANVKVIIRALQLTLTVHLALDENNGIRVLLNGAGSAKVSQ